MTTLAQVTLSVARKVSKVQQGTATGGSTTTLIDAAGLIQQNGYWKGGILWLIGDDEYTTITAHSGNTLSFATRATAITAGQRYAVMNADFPIEQLISAVNEAISEIGKVRRVNHELTVNAEYSVYDLSALVEPISNIVKIEIMDPDDETIRWESTNWEEFDAELVFDTGRQPSNDDDIILIHYLTDHGSVNTADGIISDEINFERLAWTAAVHALMWAVKFYGEGDARQFPMFLQNAIQEKDRRAKNRNRGLPVVRVHTR